MKKIFAIALALVMVLSMASAFAWCVTDINWACATDVCENGTGSVEVIPYVKGNGCGTGNTWTPSTCAGAVNGDKVYAAIKLTVDEDPNEEWWEDATLEMSVKGMKAGSLAAGNVYTKMDVDDFNDAIVDGALVDLIEAVEDNEGKFKAGEYYIVPQEDDDAFLKAVPADDFEAEVATLWSATVAEAAKAKFCVALKSENSFESAEVNGYTVTYEDGMLKIEDEDYRVGVVVDKDDEVEAFIVRDLATKDLETIETYNVKQTKFYAQSTETYDWTCDSLGKFLKGVMEDFELDFGTCVTEKAIKANFGWDDKVESCFSWNSDVQAVVNAECVVAIPKTGDASVLAWLF